MLFSLLAVVALAAPDDLAAIGPRVEARLREEMKLWYPRAIDEELGGFHENFARDWSPRPDAGRSLVYQSRMTWTAAAFARFSPKDREEFLGYARHGIEYLDRVMRDKEDGGFHFVLGPKGQIDREKEDEKHVYGTAFALFAASEVHEATGDELALKVARAAFHWLETQAADPRDGGYFEAISSLGRPLMSQDDSVPVSMRKDRLGVYYGFKSMNSHIHLLEAIAAFARVEKTPEVRKRLREVLAIVRDKIAVEPGALNLYFTRDWRPVPAHDSFGHDVETAYLLIEAAEVLGKADEKTLRVARSLVDHALDWGWDETNGGFYDKGDSFGAAAYDTTKIWWTQAEGLNALLLMHEKFGRETDRYARAFAKQWDFIERHQIDPEHGGWFGEVTKDGKLLGDGAKAHPWKANYHAGRAMMNVARKLRPGA